MTLFATRYEIGELLGSGGYGTVYRAHDHNLGRDVALKLFNPGDNQVLAVKEARILTHLEGDHILRVFNADVHQDIPYLATAIASERSTEDYLNGNLGVRPDFALRWLRHLLVGLRVTHGADLVHRDITPSNLFLHNEDHALLGDFGVAVSLGPEGTAAVAGNMRTRPPEAYTEGSVDHRSDIWSAGVTGWRLLTGRWPFEAEAQADLETEVVSGPGQRLRDVSPHVPRQLAHCIEQALSVTPEDRHPTAEAMDRSLSRIPTLRRIWVETHHAPGATRSWMGSSAAGLEHILVHAEATTANTWEITTRYASSGRRLKDRCSSVRARRLNVALRQVFDSL